MMKTDDELQWNVLTLQPINEVNDFDSHTIWNRRNFETQSNFQIKFVLKNEYFKLSMKYSDSCLETE